MNYYWLSIAVPGILFSRNIYRNLKLCTPLDVAITLVWTLNPRLHGANDLDSCFYHLEAMGSSEAVLFTCILQPLDIYIIHYTRGA